MDIDFIVAGTQKAGTTFIHHCLMDHPDIYMPEEEVALFSNSIKSRMKYYKNTLIEMKNAQEKVKGIKRPEYIIKLSAMKKIKKMIPKVKLIFCLRNPVDRAISGYFHNMRMMLNPFVNPNKGLLHLVRYKKFKDYPRSKYLLEYGLYSKYLRRSFNLFAKQQVLVILYDDLKRNKVTTIQKIYKFLGVNPRYIPKSINETPMKGYKSMSRIFFLRLKSKFLYKKIDKKNPSVIPKSRNKQDALGLKLVDTLEKYFYVFFPEKDFIVGSNVKEALLKYYIRDICNLENILKTSLSQWKIVR